jgi:hypothetical protein
MLAVFFDMCCGHNSLLVTYRTAAFNELAISETAISHMLGKIGVIPHAWSNAVVRP